MFTKKIKLCLYLLALAFLIFTSYYLIQISTNKNLLIKMLNNGFPLFSIGEINIIILIAFIIAALNVIVIKEYELITGIAIIISTIIIMFTSFTFWNKV